MKETITVLPMDRDRTLNPSQVNCIGCSLPIGCDVRLVAFKVNASESWIKFRLRFECMGGAVDAFIGNMGTDLVRIMQDVPFTISPFAVEQWGNEVLCNAVSAVLTPNTSVTLRYDEDGLRIDLQINSSSSDSCLVRDYVIRSGTSLAVYKFLLSE